MRTTARLMITVALGLGGCGGDDGGADDDPSTSSTGDTTATATGATSATADTTGSSSTSATSTTTSADGSSTGGGSGSSSDGSTSGAIPIPDPGNNMDDWIASGDVSTPQTAWPVGIATMSPGYIEAMADANNGNAYWVFEAGPALTELVVTAAAFTNTIEFIHLHGGSGGVFGEELMATSMVPCCGDAGFTGTWDVTPGNVYVFEVHVPGGATV